MGVKYWRSVVIVVFLVLIEVKNVYWMFSMLVILKIISWIVDFLFFYIFYIVCLFLLVDRIISRSRLDKSKCMVISYFIDILFVLNKCWVIVFDNF